jgi:dTDP-4-amino-4,6-dideoxygalactose transaminase
MKVPMIDLKAQYATMKSEILAAVQEVFDEQYFILGPRVKSLEEKVAALCGVGHGIGVSSGSDAILLALMTAGVGPGDEVVTTPYSFFSTVSSIVRLGAKVVLADIEPDTFNLDPQKAAAVCTQNTRVVMPVHLFGHLADGKQFQNLGREKGIVLIEDAAQVIGAQGGGFQAGQFGSMACFSFYPTKNLGGTGEGGMVVTDDEESASSLRMLRVHGGQDKYVHLRVGINGRLDELQAAVLLVKLPHLAAWNEARRAVAARYREGFKGLPIVLPTERPGFYHTYHQFVVRVEARDRLMKHLRDHGIGCDIYYPIPLHLQECFRDLGYGEGDFPIAEQSARDSLALPIYAELSERNQDEVIARTRDFFGQAQV